MIKLFFIIFVLIFLFIFINNQLINFEFFNDNSNMKDKQNIKNEEKQAKISGTFELNNGDITSNNSSNIQSGIYTDNKNNGIITFPKPFLTIPKVFIQSNNQTSSKSSVINVSNISLTDFTFSKNQIYEEETGSFSSSVVTPDISSGFSWMAIT